MTEFTASIVDSQDDAWERQDGTGLSITQNNNSVKAGPNNSNRDNTGLRFENVTIPQGATIDSATISVTFAGASFDTIKCDIHCNDVDDAADFTTEADVTSRARTSDSTEWDEVDSSGTSPDFKNAVQEVINRPGWESGNALMVILAGGTNGSALQALFRDFTNGSGEASITINYTEPASGANIKRRRDMSFAA